MAQITRRAFVAGAAASGAAAQRRKPNIVYLFPDQHRNFSWPGGGDPQVRTPNLDLLARQGATFTNCISNYPLCSPYRANMLTGRYGQANGITGNLGGKSKPLAATEVTIGDVLKKEGYATGYVGKWHLYPGAGDGRLVPAGPDRHGFDYWRVCYNYRKRYDTRYFDDAGKEVVIRDYAPKGQMDLALDFIEKNAAQPFCVIVSYHPPHSPYTEAPKRFADLYSPESVKLRPNVPKEVERKWREAYAGYFASVSALDDETGRLMRKLDQLGIAENTIVCYTSDHGDMLGSQGLSAKNKPWEEAINVPFVVRWPAGIPAGRRLDTLFSTVDITPTLLGLAEIAAPSRMQGADISRILRGKGGAGPESSFIMSLHEGENDDTVAGGWRGVRTARYTYAVKQRPGGAEPWVMYDNRNDPYQMHNLIGDAAHGSTRGELEGLLQQWRRRVGEA